MSSSRLSDRDQMPFGAHKGKPMEKVPAEYLDWLDGQDWLKAKWPRIKEYIRFNRAVIDKELEDPKGYAV